MATKAKPTTKKAPAKVAEQPEPKKAVVVKKSQSVTEPPPAPQPIVEVKAPHLVGLDEKILFTKGDVEFIGSIDADGHITKYAVVNGVCTDSPVEGAADDFTVTPISRDEVIARLY